MWPTYITLTGLVLDIIGAFILAVEAIGTKRVREWKDSEGLAQTSVYVGFGIFVGALFAGASWLVRNDLDFDLPFYFAILVLFLLEALMLGFAIGVWLLFARFLIRVSDRADRKAAGLLGFGLLAMGFVLQFTGTLLGALQ